jgi:hypothetical protein
MKNEELRMKPPAKPNWTRVVAVALSVVSAMAVAGIRDGATAAQAIPDWVTLFDGSNLNAFNPVGDANWTIVEGVVQADMGNGYLVTKESYSDFHLRLEFWVDGPANSGIFIRCADPQQITADNSYEVNIFDTRPDQSYRTGGIVNVAMPMAIVNTADRWNRYEIRALGPRLTVWVNGSRTVDIAHDGFKQGPIALQYGAGVVKFRNVQISVP